MTDYAAVVAINSGAVLLDMYGQEGAPGSTFSPNNLGERGFMELNAAVTAEENGLVCIAQEHLVRRIEETAGGRFMGRVTPGERAFPSGHLDAVVTGIGTREAKIEVTGDAATANGTIDYTMEVDGLEIPNIPSSGYFIMQKNTTVAGVIMSALEGLQDAGATRTTNASATGFVVTVTEQGGGIITGLTVVFSDVV